MSNTGPDVTNNTRDAVLARVQALCPAIRERAAAAEAARTIPRESVDELIAAEITRILMPQRFGGYGLGLDTWVDAMLEIGKADASHAWCAGLMIHHPHYIAQFPEAAQKAVWADGADVAIAGSILPVGKVTPVPGGYRLSGRFGFASGVNHSPWVFLGGMVETAGPPEWTFFLVGPGDYTIADTWFTEAMCATGSNTIVCDEAFVPESHTVRLSDLREGKSPGGAIHADPIYRAPFVSYAGLCFATPILGAARGAYEIFRDWTRTRRGIGGVVIAETVSIQTRLARIAADLDAAELLLRRGAATAQGPAQPSLALRARAIRDYARVAELGVEAIDTIVAMSGTAIFAANHPIQRAWRDIHFAAAHISINPESSLAHFGRMELGLPPDTHRPLF